MMDSNPSPSTKPQFRATLKSFGCQKCRKTFPHITVMEIRGVRTVLVDGAIFTNFKFQCPSCGSWNYHDVNTKKIEKQNEMLAEILLKSLYGKNADESAIIKDENSKVVELE